MSRNIAHEEWTSRYLPARFEEAALTDLTPEQDPGQRISRWFASDTQTLLILGDSGTGKTHAATAMGSYVTAGGEVHTAMWTAADLIADFKSDGFPQVIDGEDQTWLAVQGYDVLIVDDLGGEASTPEAVEWLERLVDYRWRNRQQMIVTTRLSQSALVMRYSRQMVYRLTHDATIVELPPRKHGGSSWLPDLPW